MKLEIGNIISTHQLSKHLVLDIENPIFSGNSLYFSIKTQDKNTLYHLSKFDIYKTLWLVINKEEILCIKQ